MENLTEYMQQNVLSILIQDNLKYKLIIDNLKSNYFESSYYRKIYQKVCFFIKRFKKVPGKHIYDLLEKDIAQDDIYNTILDDIFTTEINSKYVLEQFNSYIRQQQLKIGIISAAESIEQGKIEEAEKHLNDLRKQDIKVFNKGSHLDADFLDEGAIETIPCGIDPLDAIGATSTKGDCIALGALPGYGKSHYLTHLGKVGCMTRHKVLHITLEMSEMYQKQRYIQSMFNISKRESESFINILDRNEYGYLDTYKQEKIVYDAKLTDNNIKKVIAKKLQRIPINNLIIKAFPSGQLTMSMLRNYLDTLIDYENFMPDLILLDYPKKMKLNPKFVREELGIIYIDLKGIAEEYKIAIAYVAQFNREAKKNKEIKWIDESYLQEDFSLINEVSWFITYNQTSYEYEQKLARLYVSKGRHDIKSLKLLVSQDYNCCQFAIEAVKLQYNDMSYKIKE